MISIIIPIYNEEQILLKNSQRFRELSKRAEMIFADAGSNDRSVDIVSSYARVLNCKKGRALQMNCAAEQARHKILLFLHADSIILPPVLLSIERSINIRGFVAGCLTQRIDKGGIIYRLIESQGNIRARLSKVFYGDQGIFVKKDVFFNIGGFPQVPIMEDVLFTKKLRKAGKIIVLPDEVVVSARRWEKKGIIKTMLLYNRIILLFKLGVPLDKIKLLYDDLR